MKVIVCLKQIPDPERIEFDLTDEKMKSLLWVLNPADFHALEEGLRIKEKCGGQVVAMSAAPARGDGVLNKALIYGADRAIRIWKDSLTGGDTWMTASFLKSAIETIGFNLIICGNKSRDTSSRFMGAALSEKLNVPFLTGIVGLEFPGGNRVIADKKLDRGGRETFSCELPAVVAVDEAINQPRYVALYSRAYREGITKKIEVMEPATGEPDPSPLIELLHIGQPKPRTKMGRKVSGLSVTELMKVMRGESGGKKEVFTGSASLGAKKIADRLKEWYF